MTDTQLKQRKILKGNHSIRFFSHSGFTIAEMLIVTIVMGILFGIASRTYFDERNRFLVNEAFNQMVGMINTARNAATSGQTIFSPDDNMNLVPPSGYGIYIDLNPADGEPHFTLFASIGDDDNQPDTFNNAFDKLIPATHKDIVLETYRLPAQLNFQFLSFDTGSGYQEKWYLQNQAAVQDATEAVIFFRPPLAEAFIANNASTPLALEQLKMRFFNPLLPENSNHRCPVVEFNRLRGFPVLSYTNCKESAYPL